MSTRYLALQLVGLIFTATLTGWHLARGEVLGVFTAALAIAWSIVLWLSISERRR